MKKRKSKKNVNNQINNRRFNYWGDTSILLMLIALVYTGLMLFLSLKYHRIGGYEVEADFYADFAVVAKKLLAGDFSPVNFNLKGPVYYVFLALFKLVFRDYFRAGLIMNVLAAGGVVWLILSIVRHLFGTKEAVLTALFTLSNFAFLHYTYSVGTDMVMCLFSFLTIYFLLTMKHTRTSLILAGLFACLAFLTRYNAVFLYPAGIFSIFLMDWGKLGGKTILKNSGIFLGSSILFGLPWYIPNMIVRGSPVYNTNIIVLKLNYYGEQLEQVEAIKSIANLVLLDPFYFFKKTLANIGYYLRRDFYELMNLYFSAFILVGIVLLVVLLATKRIRFSGKQWAFFLFPVLHFTVLVFAHYNIRFSFLRLPFYASLLFIPMICAVKINVVKNRKLRTGIFVFLLVLVLVKFYPGYLKIRSQHEKKPDPEFILDFAAFMRRYNVDESYGVISRKPHISHYSGLRMVMFPNNLKTLEELYAYAKKERAKFLLMSYIEYTTRPYYRFMIDNIREYPGFTPVMRSEWGVIYLIDVQ